MNESEVVSSGYKELFGESDFQIELLPQSGSDRKYFRIYEGKKSIIGVYNANFEENKAFIGFSRHFISKGFSVPAVLGYIPEKFVYFLQDLGDTNLFTWLLKHPDAGFDEDTEALYRKILDDLIKFQVQELKDLISIFVILTGASTGSR